MAEEQPQGKRANAQSTEKTPVETEHLNVTIERDGQEVSSKWGLHPRVKEELTPEEWKELTDAMGKVTDIVGKRFTEILARGQKEAGGTA